MNEITTAQRVSIGFAAVTFVGFGYAGVKTWKAHPVLGFLVGGFIVAPAANAVFNVVFNPSVYSTPSNGQAGNVR